MTKDEALKLALEALTVLLDEWTPARQAQLKGMEAVTALKQARSAPVQELQRYSPDGAGSMEVDSLGAYVKHQDVTTPPAQPAVPDAIIEAGESPEFRDGWNECRETMLQMLKARSA
jgi:hypothetical protein